jgi:hypothetical protein
MNPFYRKVSKMLLTLFCIQECGWIEKMEVELGRSRGSHRCLRKKGHKGRHKCHCGEKFGKEE